MHHVRDWPRKDPIRSKTSSGRKWDVLTVVPLERLDDPAEHRGAPVSVVVHRPMENPAHEVGYEVPHERPRRRPQSIERRRNGRQRLGHTRHVACGRRDGGEKWSWNLDSFTSFLRFASKKRQAERQPRQSRVWSDCVDIRLAIHDLSFLLLVFTRTRWS